MKKIKISHIIIATALIGTMTTVGVSSVSAATSMGRTDPMNNLATLIAQKFNLNVTDVQKVFEEQRAQMKATHSAEYSTRINQAVTDGKLTQAQATLILAKKAEMEANQATMMASFESKTAVERLAAKKAEMDALKVWATTNNVPLEYLRPGGKGGHENFGSHGKFKKRGPMTTQ